MIRLLKWLIFGDAHLHKWVDYRAFTISGPADANPKGKRVIIRECEHCGKLENHDGFLI